MQKSDSIAALAAALSKAQGSIRGAVKDSDNPFFKSRYADLASVVEAIRCAFSENGLSYTQVIAPSEKEEVSVETVILHASGEWLSCGVLSLPVSKSDAQGYGSALTYARRYGLSAAAGVAPEDDDGNAAASARPPKPAMDCSKHLLAFAAAPTLEDLSKVFTVAYKAAQSQQDSAAMSTLTGAKNKRKSELSV